MFFDTSYDPYRFASPSPSYANMRRQELARRQRAMEEERRRKAGIERRRRMEAELARRREIELWQREKSEMERSRRQGLAQKQPIQRNLPSYQVVRGPDGSLYRVPLKERNDVVKSQSDENRGQKDTSSYQIVRGPDGRLYRVPCSERDDVMKSQSNKNCDTNVTPSKANSESKEEEVVCTKSESKENDDGSVSSDKWYEYREIDDGLQKMAPDAAEEKHVLSPASPQIVVENVPNEEDEELREMRSIWRNRTPGPGQWMEPVETYQQ